MMFIEYIEKIKKTTLSRMELDEFIILLQKLKDYYSSVNSSFQDLGVIQLEKRVENLKKKHKLKNDTPFYNARRSLRIRSTSATGFPYSTFTMLTFILFLFDGL